MPFSWSDLRPIEGSNRDSFEELCCQLARNEPPCDNSKFIRKGHQDAGVECFWILPDGDEHCWQAKFFLESPTNQQWSQIDRSVKKALNLHPAMTKYTICIPINRSDRRKPDETSCLEKWFKHVAKWESLAKKKGIEVKFNFWGDSEIRSFLSLEKHAGRTYYFFHTPQFSNDWFSGRVNESISNAGPRYTPDLNVNLPIAQLFDGLARNDFFYQRLRKLKADLENAFKDFAWRLDSFSDNALVATHETLLTALLLLLDTQGIFSGRLDLDAVLADTEAIKIAHNTLHSKLLSKRKAEPSTSSKKERNVDSILYELRKYLDIIYDVERIFSSKELQLANTPALLIHGVAGAGKTHLCCDIANHRIKDDEPTILLYGNQFKDANPWHQIISELHLNCNRDEFLGALEAAGEARNTRVLIIVDALNKSSNPEIWRDYLGGILDVLSRYNHIGVVFTVRESYRELVVPEGSVTEKLVYAFHEGFKDYEDIAAIMFFEYYNIEYPSSPLLHHEYQNPLFLKLLCEGLNRAGIKRIPKGIKGITTVFNIFLDSVNKKLSDILDYDEDEGLVNKAVEALAHAMSEAKQSWIVKDEAKELVNALYKTQSFKESLFSKLLEEGVIAEDVFYLGEKGSCIGVGFSYERLSDHLRAGDLLARNLDKAKADIAFSKDGELHEYIADESSCNRNRGLIEAFAIQIPELIGKELIEVAPDCIDYHPVKLAFIDSIVWRKPNAFSKRTDEFINNHIINYAHTRNAFFRGLLTLSNVENHPYNAIRLHDYLFKLNLADRDYLWSMFLHEEYSYESQSIIQKLIEWAWLTPDTSGIPDESLYLYSLALGWFLTSSNRFIRDRTTKAMVRLLSDNLGIVVDLLEKFKDVNDPYVAERLYAVAYGCAMRSNDSAEIEQLAVKVYDLIFKNGNVIPHILLRDYARGVVECALSRGIELTIDIEKIRPPYDSVWSSDIPSVKELAINDLYSEDMTENELALWRLYRGIVGNSDFSRYIIGTNTPNFEWSSRPLIGERPLTIAERAEEFILSLTGRQLEIWDAYTKIVEKTNEDFRETIMAAILKGDHEEVSKDIDKIVSKYEIRFRRSLGKRKLTKYEEIRKTLGNRNYREEFSFDLSIAERWIFQKVIDLGWTPEIFGRYDWSIKRSGSGRNEHKPERIGKKYMWIAYHEFLARVADNFEFVGNRYNGDENDYKGPWQISYVRDIDPSNVLLKTKSTSYNYGLINWWNPVEYSDWQEGENRSEWLKSCENLPDVSRLIEVTDPKDKSKWLNINGYTQWEERLYVEDDSYEKKRKHLWYKLKGYLIKECDREELRKWAEQTDFCQQRMPSSIQETKLFLGEYFWAPSFRSRNIPYYGREGWTDQNGDIPAPIMVVDEDYLQESSVYDCSIDETISISLPCQLIVESMNLTWKGKEGKFFNNQGELIAFDPSVSESGPSALLIRKEQFLDFLESHSLGFLWLLQGEKRIIGGYTGGDDYLGMLEISGVYQVINHEIKGSYKAVFDPPRLEGTT